MQARGQIVGFVSSPGVKTLSFVILHMRFASISVSHLLLPIITGGGTGYETETCDWLKPKATPNSSAPQSSVGEQNSRQNAESRISTREPNAQTEVGWRVEEAHLEAEFCQYFSFHFFQREFAVRREEGKFFFFFWGWN